MFFSSRLAMIAIAVSLGFSVFASEATASSAAGRKEPIYTYVNLSSEKPDNEALILGSKLLATAPDGKEILNGAYGQPDIAARFMDKDKILIAIKINNDCGTLGCPTFIYLQTDKSKNFWVRAFDDLSYNLWIMNDGSGKYKIVTQALTTAPIKIYELSGTNFIQRAEPAQGTAQ